MLNTLGAPIPDEMFAILLSASLPDSWDSFTRSYFGNKGKAMVTSQELIGLIIDKAKRLDMKRRMRKLQTKQEPSITTDEQQMLPRIHT